MTGGEYFRGLVSKMTPEQREARSRKITRLLDRCDRWEKKSLKAAEEFHAAEENLKKAKAKMNRYWHLYVTALELAPHPVCIV